MGTTYKTPSFTNESKTKLNSTYTNVNTLSVNWENCFTSVSTTSGTWNTALQPNTDAIVTGLSATNYIDIQEISDPTVPSATMARIWASDTNGKTNVNIIGNDNIKQRIMRDLISTVRNTTESAILKGTLVYNTGATGTAPNIAPSIANSRTTMPAIGITMEDMLPNAYGRIQRFGRTEFTLDTSDYEIGDELYVSPLSAGKFTIEQPPHPYYPQSVGVVVVKGVGNGSVFTNFTTYYNGHSDGTTHSSFTIGENTTHSHILTTTATEQRTLYMPNSSGTLALLTDLQNLSSNLVSNNVTISATNGLQIGPSNTSTFYLVDSATVWNDLVMPFQSGRTGGVAATFTRWGTGGLYVFKVDANDEFHFAFQLPHDWKCGTVIYPHIHWCQDDITSLENPSPAPAAGLSAVRWNLEVAWTGIPGGVFYPNSTITYWNSANVIGANKQILTNIPEIGINPSSFAPYASSISSIFVCRLYRGGTGDTYGATRVNALSFDIHYEVDSLGSENIVQKYI